MMKILIASAATAALLVAAGPVSAQMMQPMNPVMSPAPMQTYQPMDQGPVRTMQQPTYTSGAPSWMQDDGSSSDHPIHNPGDRSGDRLNSQYRGGLTTAPGTGFPAQWDNR
jgi:hypothetical protein